MRKLFWWRVFNRVVMFGGMTLVLVFPNAMLSAAMVFIASLVSAGVGHMHGRQEVLDMAMRVLNRRMR